MKFNKRKLLRYRITSWLVIALITFQSGPMQVWGALNNPANNISAGGSGFAGHPMPVDFESGALMLLLEDLSFKNDALPLNLTRYYRSDLDLKSRGIFGNRWHSILDMHLEVEGDTVRLIDEQASERIYKLSSDGFYISEKWEYEELHKVTANGAVGYERKLKTGVSYLFDTTPNHRLTEIKDRNGRFLKINRDITKGTVKINDRYGRWIEVTLKGGFAVAAHDSLERNLQYSYDVNGNLSAVTTHAGGQHQIFYDSKSRMARFNVGEGRWYSFKYHNGLLSEQRSNVGLIAEYDYNKKNDGLLVVITDAVKCKETIHFATGGAVNITAADGSVGQILRNSRSLPVKGKMADGESFEIAYDGRFNISKITQNDAVTLIKYNQFDMITEVQQPTGELIKLEYDSQGNPIVVNDPFGASTSLVWNDLGQIIKINQPDGRCMELSYDKNGLPASLSDNIEGLYKFDFSSNGLMSSYDSPTGVKTSLKYNEAGIPIVVENSEEQRIDLFHDKYGNLTRMRDSLENSFSYQYDSMGMLTKAEDPLGGVTDLTWRKDGSLSSLTDAGQNTTSWDYDQAGRIQKETDATGAIRKTGYDAVGRPAEYINARGQKIKIGYDMFGRVNALTSDSENSMFDYDASGRMIMMKNAHSEYHMAFGSKGEVESVKDGVLDKSVAYTYDAIGRRSRMTTPDGIVSYSYDAVGRIESIKKNGQSVVFAYDQFGRRSQMSFSNGVVTSYAYDKLNRVTEISAKNKTGAVLTSVKYVYDKLDRVISTVDEKGIDKKYEYDAKGQLTKVIQGDNLTEYEYDLVGNRKSVIRNGERTDYHTGPNNQLLSAGGDRFKYDADGNLISKVTADGKSYTYAYDEASRMISAQGPKGSVDYKYSPNGIKVARKFEDKELRYLFDGGDIISEISNGETEAEYLHGPGVDEWLMVERGGSQLSCHADRMGSVIAQADQTGNLTRTFSFDEFGKPDKKSSESSCLTSFTGREWDPVANMHYYRARFYSPETGKFNTLDPLGLTQGQNQYSYVFNNPLKFKDPSGCVIVISTLAAAAIIGAVVGGVFDLIGQDWKKGFDIWSLLASMGLGALVPFFAVAAVKTIIAAAVIGAVEYIGRVISRGLKFDVRKFIHNIGKRTVDLLVSIVIGKGIGRGVKYVTTGIRNLVSRVVRRVIGPRAIKEIVSNVIGNTVNLIYNAVSTTVNNMLAPGSGGGDSDEYKRFQRFEAWSN